MLLVMAFKIVTSKIWVLILFYFYFYFLITCVHLCRCLQKPERVSDPLEVKLQAVVSLLTRVPGTHRACF